MNTSIDNQGNIYDNDALSLLKGVKGEVLEYTSGIVRIRVHPDKLLETVEAIVKNGEVYLRTMSASDERSVEGCYKLYYVFGIDKLRKTIVIETPLCSDKPQAPTLINIVKAIDWYEKEAHDLLGIEFIGRRLYRFVLPEDWPSDVYPLRKDYTIHDLMKLYKPRIIERAKEVEAEAAVIIPIGPYHPALHEPEYFELYVRGEKVVDARYVGFMVHRGIEKLGENMKYDQVPFLAERICGICGFVHSTSYCQAVENALKIDVPERAHYIRSIILEIERIHSHLLWLGVALHLLGYDTGFMHIWRIREDVMVLAELLTGSRKTYGLNLVGGVRRDIDIGKANKCLKILEDVGREFKQLVEVSVSVPQVKARLKGTGYLSRNDAESLSLVGPTARGSGLARDVRRDYPYAAYKYVDVKPVVYSEGDNLSRTMVRVDEVFQSIELIREFIENMPQGDIINKDWEVEPGRVGIGSVEAPRGEVIHIVRTGKYSPYRWRVRTPTYQNLPAVPIMLRETDLADAPLTIASIDPCFSCTDRVIVLDMRTNSVKEISIAVFTRRGLSSIR